MDELIEGMQTMNIKKNGMDKLIEGIQTIDFDSLKLNVTYQPNPLLNIGDLGTVSVDIIVTREVLGGIAVVIGMLYNEEDYSNDIIFKNDRNEIIDVLDYARGYLLTVMPDNEPELLQAIDDNQPLWTDYFYTMYYLPYSLEHAHTLFPLTKPLIMLIRGFVAYGRTSLFQFDTNEFIQGVISTFTWLSMNPKEHFSNIQDTHGQIYAI